MQRPSVTQEISGKARPRGSRSGLVTRQAESVVRTSAALNQALIQLRSNSPSMHITEKALCHLAGLKSTIALHSLANADCLNELLEHNASLRKKVIHVTAHSKDDEERDKLILRQDAEISFLLRQNQRLKRHVKSLQERLAAMN